MRKIIIALVLAAAPVLALALPEGVKIDHAPINPANRPSLQRGARLFMNYCSGCHSLQYQRYNRLARDFGLSNQQVAQNLIFTANTKPGDTIQNAMRKEEAKLWFGAPPPDLSVIARARAGEHNSGADYLYTYLRSFYYDPKRPFGTNNTVFPSVSMPNVLWELQGRQEPVYKEETGAEGKPKKVLEGFRIIKPGSRTPEEFDRDVADVVNFLTYVAEPVQLERKSLGIWVLAYLVLAFIVFYRLKVEYWKDVHG